ncbi:hypothetical protein PIB30_110081, partial [Stylosanthes scabra]|nr:hypothetical protein [Stylosanthes scabra]
MGQLWSMVNIGQRSKSKSQRSTIKKILNNQKNYRDQHTGCYITHLLQPFTLYLNPPNSLQTHFKHNLSNYNSLKRNQTLAYIHKQFLHLCHTHSAAPTTTHAQITSATYTLQPSPRPHPLTTRLAFPIFTTITLKLSSLGSRDSTNSMASSSSTISVFDAHRFRTAHNEQLFESYARRRKVNPEVGFNLEDAPKSFRKSGRPPASAPDRI